MPIAPGPPPEPDKAEREQVARDRACGDAEVARFHLLGAFSIGVIVMGLVLAVVVVLFVVVLLSHH
jgi:hypothetical protein